MKKTFNINISGFGFTVDEDAYDLLNDYLDTLQHAFSTEEDSREIIADIECRIAELLTERQAGSSAIVTLEDVKLIIARIGRPEDMMETDKSASTTDGYDAEAGRSTTAGSTGTTGASGISSTPPPYYGARIERKLFRDPQDAMIGGVCAGLAAYFKVDVTWVRLLTVALSLLSFTTAALVYLILWIVLPEASTPYQRMQMSGEQPTMANIGRSVTEGFDDVNKTVGSVPQPDNRTGWMRFLDSLTNICAVVAKILLFCLVIVAIPVVGALAVGLLGCVFAIILLSSTWGTAVWNNVAPDSLAEMGDPILGLVLVIGAILTIGIPLFALIWVILMKSHPMNKGWRVCLLASWIIGFITMAVCCGIITADCELGKLKHKHGIDKVVTIDSTYLDDDDDIDTDSAAEVTDSIRKVKVRMTVEAEAPDKK